jgi:hypothetical protein
MRRLALLGVLLALMLLPVTGVSGNGPIDPEAARLAAIEAINTDSEQFGGVYIDEAGVLVIQYVGENRGRAAVERVLVPEVAVRWVQVERSQDELARIANEIRQRKLDGVFAISIETLTNRVEIWLDEYAPRSTLAAAFAAEYADAIFIRPGTDILYAAACNSRTDCTPWRGGIRIDRNNDNGWCTWGFQAKRNGNLQMITAGHCQERGKKFNHNGSTIGSNGVSRNSINPDTFDGIDVSRTRIDGAYPPNNTNRLYFSGSLKNHSLTSERTNNQFAVGQVAVKSGARTDTTAGQITSTNFSYQLIPAQGAGSLVHYPNCTFETRATCPEVWGLKVSNIVAKGGDSGSPVYSGSIVPPYGVIEPGSVLFGFVSAANADLEIMVFAPAQTTRQKLTLDQWCFTNSC